MSVLGKTLMILGGSELQLPAIEKAIKMGHKVIVCDCCVYINGICRVAAISLRDMFAFRSSRISFTLILLDIASASLL